MFESAELGLSRDAALADHVEILTAAATKALAH
jgi:hypothetical protein